MTNRDTQHAYCTVSSEARRTKNSSAAIELDNTTPWRHTRKWRCSSTHSVTLAVDGGEWQDLLGRPATEESATWCPLTDGPRGLSGLWGTQNTQLPPAWIEPESTTLSVCLAKLQGRLKMSAVWTHCFVCVCVCVWERERFWRRAFVFY
jgi:hypothetical protein